MKDYKDLKRFAEAQGFIVTSTTAGKHNRGSKHFLGLAIDVRTRDKSRKAEDLFIFRCRRIGIIVRDEREKPAGQKVWSGEHLHLEIGAQTDASVREFQQRHGLAVDGIVGAKTLAVLNGLF